MRLIPLAAAGAMLGGMLFGCARRGPEAVPPPDPQRVAALRSAYQQAQPDIITGIVVAKLEDQPLVAVGEVPVERLNLGDVVSFVGPNQQVLTFGTVVRILPDNIFVQYEPPPAGRREPVLGDLVVRFPR